MADKKIGKYEILDRVGSGDMGTVYKAKDSRLGRFVAIKVISPDRKVTEELKARFFSEAQASAGLSHPNIVGIIDIDEEKDLLYTVMELLEGSDLKKIAADKADVSVEDKINAMMQAASALQHAHGKSIVHGNLKPGKIVLQKDGTTKLLDFGGGRLAATSPGGIAPSSLRYMSAEQAAGNADAKSDQYALGAVFYEAFGGAPPFTGDDPKQLAEQIKSGKPKPLSEIEPNLPADLVKVIEKAMSKSPADRYADLDAMRADLEAVLKRIGDEAKGVKEKLGGILAELGKLEADVSKRLGIAAPAVAAGAPAEHFLALTRRSKEAQARVSELKEKAAKLDKAEPQLQAGTKLLGENKFAEARKELEAVVALVPEHNAAKEALEKAKKGEEQEKNRQAVRKLLDEAKKALESKNPEASLASLEKIPAIPGSATFEAEIITIRNDAKKLKEELEAKKLARQFAERARASVVDAKLPAESQGGAKYAAATWAKANEETTKGNTFFQQEKFAESQAAFEGAAKLYATAAEEARQGREKERREAEEAENQRRLKATNEILEEAKKALGDKAYSKALEAIARTGKVPAPDSLKGEIQKLREQIEAAHQTEQRAKKPAQTARLLMTETRASAVAEGAEGRKSPQWVEGEAKSAEGTAAFGKEHFVDAHSRFEAAVVAYQGALDDARKAKAKAAEEAEAARKKAEAEGRSQVANAILGQAREAMQRGDHSLCLDLLEAAGKVSPSQDAVKEITSLREAAQKAQKDKQSADAAKQAADAERQKAEKARDLVIEAVRVLHGQSSTDTSSRVWDEMEAKVAEAHTAFGKGSYAAAFSAYEAGLALCQKFEDDMRAAQKKEAEAKAAAEKAAAAAKAAEAAKPAAQQPAAAPPQGAKPVGAPPAQPGARPPQGGPVPPGTQARPAGTPPAQPAQPAQPAKSGAPAAATAAGAAGAAAAKPATAPPPGQQAKAATPPPAGQQARPAQGAAPAQAKPAQPAGGAQAAQSKPAQTTAAQPAAKTAAPAAGGAAAAASAASAAKPVEPAKPAVPTVKTEPEGEEAARGGLVSPIVILSVLAVASVIAVLFINFGDDTSEQPKQQIVQKAPATAPPAESSVAATAAEVKAAADAQAIADKKVAEDARAEAEAKLAAETKAAADAKAAAEAEVAAKAGAEADTKAAAEAKAAQEAKAAEEAKVAAQKAAEEKAAAEAKAAEEAKKAAEEKAAAEAKAAEAAAAAKAAAEAKAAADAKAAEAAATGAAPVQIKAYASVYNEPTDGKHSGGAWGACWRGDLAAAQACAKASCERTRSSDQPCSESASAEPGGHCAVASASGFGVSWGACSTTQQAAESAAMAGCRSQTNRRYPGENATCRIAWSSTPK